MTFAYYDKRDKSLKGTISDEAINLLPDSHQAAFRQLAENPGRKVSTGFDAGATYLGSIEIGDLEICRVSGWGSIAPAAEQAERFLHHVGVGKGK